ncbi:hypothetical protein [Anabaena sp. UHCC 0451]|uniref:hypothetical protein n=1 Tax=Anabaena sp. UHCC 0451 TaxID=2055235 RepID=UPI002B20B707|nr:hypothetical protein [Anabaena sp. UHCC 0451]MEA5576072.1 hypothetical protein [Anabaena sp. UHCC 0451]
MCDRISTQNIVMRSPPKPYNQVITMTYFLDTGFQKLNDPEEGIYNNMEAFSRGNLKTVDIQLEETILEKALALAKSHNLDLSQLIAYAIDKLAVAEPENYPLLGLFADDPESVDAMLEEVMKDRAAHPLNQRFGQSNT